MADITIVLCGSRTELDSALSLIALAFSTDKGEWASKYGVNYENDVFMMHKYCWCEHPDCPWCYGCTCGDNDWVDHHTTEKGTKCDWCRDVHKYGANGALAPNVEPHYGAPHFWYKPTGFRMWWYKYIGRDPQTNLDSLPGDFVERIFESHPTGMTIEQALELYRKDGEDEAAMWDDLAASVGATVRRES